MLFIGSGCSLDAGFPTWDKLIRSIIDRFENEGLMIPPAIRGYLDRGDFTRAAKGLKDQDQNLYRRVMLEQIDPNEDSVQIPKWYRYIPLLFPSIVCTTNWDNIIEDHTSWRRLHWKSDPQALLEQRQSNRPSVFHIHGHIQNFDTVVHTLDEYQEFKGNAGNTAREYLSRLAESYAFLYVGYSLEDPFIDDISNSMARNWGTQPDFFKLEPNPTDELRHKARVEKSITLLAYDKEGHGSHCEGIDAFFSEVCDALGFQRPAVPAAPPLPLGVVSRQNDLIEINDAFLKSVEPPNPESVRRYFRGSQGDWSTVVHQKTARRKIVDRILKELEIELGVALIGAGGEGKSTILRQLALERQRQGWKVFYAEDTDERAIEQAYFQMRSSKKDPLLICLDHADSANDLLGVLRFASNRRAETQVIFTCREYQWSRRKDKGQILQFVNVVSVGKLTQEEAKEIAGLLLTSGAVRDESVDTQTLTSRLLDESNGFLLAAMLYATEGRWLKGILQDVISDISSHNHGEEFLNALGFVVALECRTGRNGNHFFCTQRLFKEAFGLSTAGMKQRVRGISGEVALTPRAGYLIETRHPRIAQHVSEILFDNPGYLDEMETLNLILSSAGRISVRETKPGERQLLGAIPDAEIRAGRDHAFVRNLFEISTKADPSDATIWQAWGLWESDQGNIDRARELFEAGSEADPENAAIWQAWALLERDQGDLARARELFETGSKSNPAHTHIWQAWGVLERDQGNLPQARKLFETGSKTDPSNAHIWQAWGVLERDDGNIDRARELFETGSKADPSHAPIWQAWGVLERDQGNISRAREMFETGSKADPSNVHIWQAWGVLERDQGNSARAQELFDIANNIGSPDTSP